MGLNTFSLNQITSNIHLNELGSSIDAGIKKTSPAAINAGDAFGGFLNDPINFFSGSSPDNVTTSFEKGWAAHRKGNKLTAFAQIDVDAVASANPPQLTENNASDDSSIFYNQIVESEEFKLPEGSSKQTTTQGPRPYSVFNKYSLVNYQGTPLFPETGAETKQYNQLSPSAIKNPTASQIIEITSGIEGNVGYRYDYSDFALTRFFGKIPNNMMITVRRFAFPCPDDIISPKGVDGQVTPQPDLARAITWLGEQSGNNMADILKFSHGFNWKNAEAAVQEIQSKKGEAAGSFGNLVESNSFLRNFANAAQGGDAVSLQSQRANAGYDAFSNTYPNHVFGPLNVIKEVFMRDQGLTFEQEFTLKFEYELRELGGANPKLLMLDQLANILVLTSNNAPFWGGSVRYIGDGSVSRPLGNLEHIRNGDYGSFLKSVVSDLGGGSGGFMEQAKNIIGNAGKALGGMLGGSLMEMFNSPAGGQAVNSLLTGDPTGQWHVTIGNPLNPIMVLGNLACTGTDVAFEGNMGPEDFPERMVVTIKLKPGRPRDKAEIESMFNSGRGRFYVAPKDGVDVNNTMDVSAYGNKDRKANEFTNTFRKIANG